jgi:menaquinone-dependent protoporphyrinogen oxidase
MKVLVAVASKHGSTREIGGVIAEELHNAAIDAYLRDVSEVSDIFGYDAVVLGSAIYMGKWLPEARQFAEQHRVDLARVPVWLFSSGPLGADSPQPDNDPQALAAPLGGVKVRDHRVFVGKLDPAGLRLNEWLAAKMVKAPAGDFRDWDDIRGWARGIAQSLAESATQTV